MREQCNKYPIKYYFKSTKFFVDVFIVSFSVYIILGWFEWRSPCSVSDYFNHQLILLITISTFIYLLYKNKKKKTAWSIFFISLTFLIIKQFLSFHSIGSSLCDSFSFLKNILIAIENLQFFFILLTIFSGISIFLNNKKNTGEVTGHKVEVEKNDETYRLSRFNENWKPKTLSFNSFKESALSTILIPAFLIQYSAFKLFKCAYRKSFRYALAFLIIIFLFVAIKIPHLNNSFDTKLNSAKYSSILPTVQNMYEQKNPFYYKNLKYISIFDNRTNPTFNKFSNSPIVFWFFLPFFFLKEYLSLEIITKLILTFYGVVLLFAMYLFFKNILGKSSALLFLLFWSISPIFHLITNIPNRDIFALIFMFLSLYYLLKKRETKSYLMAGFSIISKMSFGLILLPTILFIILFNKKNKTLNILKLGTFVFIIIALDSLINGNLPSFSMPIGIFLLGFEIFIIGLFYWFFEHFDEKIKNKIRSLHKIKTTGIMLALILLGIILLKNKLFGVMSNNFLTDSRLIFYLPLYKELISTIKEIGLGVICILSFLGFGIAFFTRNKKTNYLFAMLLSSIIYFVLASKSIRFALYYNHIFSILILVFLTYTVHYLYSRYSQIKYRVILFSFLASLVFLSITNVNDRKILAQDSTTSDLTEIARYIEDNTNYMDKILRTSNKESLLSLYLKNRPIILITSLGKRRNELENVRNKINEVGFYQAMTDCKVKYLITKEPAQFEELTYLFTNKIVENSQDRTSIIISKLENIDYYDFDIKPLYKTYNPDKYFELERKIGDFFIYRLIDPDEQQE